MKYVAWWVVFAWAVWAAIWCVNSAWPMEWSNPWTYALILMGIVGFVIVVGGAAVILGINED